MLRLGALGDLVLATSVTQALQHAGFSVTLVTARRYRAVAEAAVGVDHRIFFDPALHRRGRGLLALARAVGSVDLVLDLQNKPRTYLLSQLIDARQRRSLVLRSVPAVLAALVGRDPVRTDRHQVEIAYDLVRDLVEEQLARVATGPATDIGWAPRPRLRETATPRSGVALVPGAAHRAKRWPAERFGTLARRLSDAGLDVEVIAGPGEEGELLAVERAAGRRLPSSSGRGVEAVLESCRRRALVVGGDTGPLHVAAAVGTPVLSLFGPTSERRWCPLGPGRLLSMPIRCRPCSNHGVDRCPLEHHRCLQELSVETVLDAALEMLQRRS